MLGFVGKRNLISITYSLFSSIITGWVGGGVREGGRREREKGDFQH